MNEVLHTVKTQDGYVFDVMSDGTVTDGDMMYLSLNEFHAANGVDIIRLSITINALTEEKATIVSLGSDGYYLDTSFHGEGFEYLFISGLREILEYHAVEGSPEKGQVWEFVQTEHGIEWADDNEGHNLPVIRVTINNIEYFDD